MPETPTPMAAASGRVLSYIPLQYHNADSLFIQYNKATWVRGFITGAADFNDRRCTRCFFPSQDSHDMVRLS